MKWKSLLLETKEHYNLFTVDYHIITADVEVNTEIGKSLKNAINPNTILEQYIMQKKPLPFFPMVVKLKMPTK